MAVASFLWGEPLSADPPPSGGTIVIEAAAKDGVSGRAVPSFVEAASKALTARGFTIFDDPAHAAYLAELTLSRAPVGMGLGKDPHADTAAVVGTGVVVPLSTGRSNVVTLQRTRLELRIRKRDDGRVVWDGTAVTVRNAGTRKGTDQMVATDLSAALLAGYPAQPQDIVGVP
jgi:hypothetical protein